MKSPKNQRVLVCTAREGIPGWWIEGFKSSTPQSAWDVPQKQLNVDKKHCGVCNVVELEKNVASHQVQILRKYSYVRVPLPIDGGAEKKKLYHSMKKNKSKNLEPHSQPSATKSRCPEDTKTAVASPHSSESTKESIAGWWSFGLEVRLELWQNYGISWHKKTEVEEIPGVNFGIDSAIYTKYKDAGSATQVRNLIFRYTASKPSIRYPTQ